MSKVSIIIPYLKGQTYLEECVESVEKQGLDDYEIIVVNDKDGHPVPDSVSERALVKVYNAIEELPAEVLRANEERGKLIRERRIQESVEKRMSRAERRRIALEKSGSQSVYTESQLYPDEGQCAGISESKRLRGSMSISLTATTMCWRGRCPAC